MDILKVGDGPFNGSNIETVQNVFGKTVEYNRRGGYEMKNNKWVTFIYLATQRPNGEWTLPPNAPINNWLNKPNSDNTEFLRECYDENLNRQFASPTTEYAVFNKIRNNESYFYGIFKLHEERNNGLVCVYRRISTELNCAEWV